VNDVRVGGNGLVVVECLAPRDECEAGKRLGLEFEGEVEVLLKWLGWVLMCGVGSHTWTMAYTPNGTPPEYVSYEQGRAS
jgi:hypothetical protein